MLAGLRALVVLAVLGAPLAAAAQDVAGDFWRHAGRTHGSGRTFVLGGGSSVLAIVVLTGVGITGILALGARGRSAPSGRTAARRQEATARWRGVDVASIQLVCRGPIGLSAGGRAPADAADVRRAAAALRRARGEWSHAGGTSYRPMSEAMADAAYARHVRNDGSPVRPEGDAGETYRSATDSVLVTIAVAARSEIPDFQPGSVAELDRTLQALENLPNAALVAASIGSRPIGAAELGAGASTRGLVALASAEPPPVERERRPARRRLVVR